MAARLERFGDELMTLCQKHQPIENRVDVCNQLGAVCRIAMTLKALRGEEHRAEPDAGIAGSAVRKYASEVAATARRASGSGSVEATSESFIDDPCWTDPDEEGAQGDHDRP